MQDFLDELDDEVRKIKAVTTANTDASQNKTTTAPVKNVASYAEQKAIHKDNRTLRNAPITKGNNPVKQNQKQYSGRKPVGSSSSADRKQHKYGRKTLEFPETKFFLPSLREGYTRYIPIGGNNEIGAKNMSMIQYGEEILLVDCGIQFAEPNMYGADYALPDVSFLKKYTKNIKGILITHAHLDHIGCLKDILPALDMPTIYATKLTIGLIKKSLTEARLIPYTTFVEVDAGVENRMSIGQFSVEFFSVNHSIPDCAGLYIETPGGAKFVHTGDFKIDHTPRLDKPANFERYEEIGNRGITMLLSDSTGATIKGFSLSEKVVGEELDRIVGAHTSGRLIIAAFSSWISRVQQLVDSAEKYDKFIFLSGRSMVENLTIAQKLGYITMKPGTIKKLTAKNTASVPAEKQIIVTTGSQGEEYSALSRMSDGKHPAMTIQTGDTVIFSSSVVPGNEQSVNDVINKLLKYGVKIITKSDAPVHTGGHAYQEEQKIFIRLFKPKYFMPIYGDLYFRTRHAESAMEVGVKESNILMLDNGHIIDFAPNGSVFRSKIKVPLQDYIVDGYGIGLMGSHVLQAREQMMNSGVMVIHYKVDKKTKAILGHIKLETRGLVYVEEVRYIHRILIKKAREAYENTVKDVPDMEEKDLLKIIRTDLEQFILKRVDREPMVIPMITEV